MKEEGKHFKKYIIKFVICIYRFITLFQPRSRSKRNVSRQCDRICLYVFYHFRKVWKSLKHYKKTTSGSREKEFSLWKLEIIDHFIAIIITFHFVYKAFTPTILFLYYLLIIKFAKICVLSPLRTKSMYFSDTVRNIYINILGFKYIKPCPTSCLASCEQPEAKCSIIDSIQDSRTS